ncbi:MAG: hypothetical protein LUJ09_03775 [Firmicutes bacterium]|nr:hypothetical protein [Bacillota bacterium]
MSFTPFTWLMRGGGILLQPLEKFSEKISVEMEREYYSAFFPELQPIFSRVPGAERA